MKKGTVLLIAVIMTLALSAGSAMAAEQPRMEGDGFRTPQEAMAMYLKGLQDNDIDEMMSAFAIETYAVNYDIARFVERVQGFMPGTGYLPGFSDFSIRLNIENQRKAVTDVIRAHYLVLLESPTVLGEDAGMMVRLTEDYASAQELVDEMFGVSDDDILGSIRFDNEFYSPAILSRNFMLVTNLMNLKKQAAMVNAQGITSLAARFTCNGKSYLLMMDALQFGTRWYLSAYSSNIANIMGISSYQRGLVLMDSLEY